MVVVLVSGVANVAAAYIFSRLIDRLSQSSTPVAPIWGFEAYAMLIGIAAAIQHTVQYLSFLSAENLGFIARTQIFERILRKTADFFVEHNPAEIQAAGEKGQSALTALVQLVLIAFIPGTTQIVLTMVTLGSSIDIQVAFVVIVHGIFAIAVTTLANRRTNAFLDAAIEAGQENARFVGSAMNAMETLRHFSSDRWISSRFTEKAEEVRANWRAYALRRIAFILLLGIGLSVQFAVTFYLLLPRYEIGALTLGNIVLFNMLLLQLNAPFEMMAHAIDEAARARAALAPLATMWAAPEERRVAHAPAFVPRTGRIVFEDVAYTYDNGRGVKRVDFSAERGAITFLVGESGSGKSTAFRLALKSIEPATGRILVDGVDITRIDQVDWYAAVAVVPQDVMLLNESLADNILLGRPRDEARLHQAAEKAAILPFIETLANGFDTAVGERGLKLSGGERQRIAIARALYGEPRILLLDEASSALDEATERDIMEHIRALAGEVTVIAITHRRSVIAQTDKLAYLGEDRGSSLNPS